MGGVTRDRPAPRPVKCVSLNDVEVLGGFSALEALLRGCLGGGSTAVTSEAGLLSLATSSERLLAALPAPGPPLALLTSAIRHQTDVWKDGGLTCGALLAGLLARLLRLPAPRHQLRAALQLAAAECRRAAAGQQLRLQLEVPQLLAVAGTVLRSKRLPGLTAAERRHLTLQLLRAFLLVVPTEATGDGRAALGHVHVQLVSAGAVLDSTPVSALLLPEPALETAPLPAAAGPGRRRCLLFTPHLGGAEEVFDEVDVSVSASVSARPLSAERCLAALCRLPLRPGDVVACQRTVHADVRRELSGRRLLVLERLGSRGAALLARLSGAQPLAGLSLLGEVAAELDGSGAATGSALVGELDGVNMRTIGDRTYVELVRAEAAVVTLLVHCAQPEPLRDELQRQLESALFTLCCLLAEPTVVPGGGCLEAVLNSHLRQYARGQDRVVQEVTDVLCDVLRQNALNITGRPALWSDAIYHHAWEAEVHDTAQDDTCVCGLVSVSDLRGRLDWSEMTPSYFCEGGAVSGDQSVVARLDPAEIVEDTLVDCGRVRLGGLAAALEACHAILGIGTCVVEKK